MQNKKSSMNEVLLNTFSGFIVSYTVTLFMLPYFHLLNAISITSIFTVISLVRSYFWRRLFNKKLMKG